MAQSGAFLLPAIEMGDEFTPDQVLSEIESGSMQLVTFENGKAYGAVVTDGVTRGNGKKVMRIILPVEREWTFFLMTSSQRLNVPRNHRDVTQSNLLAVMAG